MPCDTTLLTIPGPYDAKFVADWRWHLQAAQANSPTLISGGTWQTENTPPTSTCTYCGTKAAHTHNCRNCGAPTNGKAH